VIKAGVPLLTHPGRSMISRMGASVNHALGLSHLVAQDREGLRQLVIDIAVTSGRVFLEKERVQRAKLKKESLPKIAAKKMGDNTKLLVGY